MKVISKSPLEETDSESESGSDSESDVDMTCVAKSYAQGDMDTDEDDEDYIESGSSDSEAPANSSDSSLASSVGTGQNSEVSDVPVSSDEEEEDDPMGAKEDEADKDSLKSRRHNLLFKEINTDQLNFNLPDTCGLNIEDPDKLHNFKVQIAPFDGYWQGGTFVFEVSVPEGFNSVPPEVKCVTKVFHPSIGADGTVGLSILRPSKKESDSGWKEGGKLKDVVLGIDSLFTAPINLKSTAVNAKAAKLFVQNKKKFAQKVKAYIQENKEKSS